jgi:hypothetical protein
VKEWIVEGDGLAQAAASMGWKLVGQFDGWLRVATDDDVPMLAHAMGWKWSEAPHIKPIARRSMEETMKLVEQHMRMQDRLTPGKKIWAAVNPATHRFKVFATDDLEPAQKRLDKGWDVHILT